MIRWPLLFLLVLLSVSGQRGATAQTGASLFVDPAEQTVPSAGDNFEVRVMVDDVTTPSGLGGYTFVMSYDPSVVHGEAITDSGFLESTGNAVICPSSGIDNESGRLAHFCFTLPFFTKPGPQTTEPAELVRVSFTAVGEGTTTLDISETTLTDPEGNTLAATTANGAVTVEGDAPDPGPTSSGPTDTGPTDSGPKEAGAPDSGPAGAGPAGTETDATTPATPAEGSAGADDDASSLPPLGVGVQGPSNATDRYLAVGLACLGAALMLAGVAIWRLRQRTALSSGRAPFDGRERG